jgi:hypothetical protein
MEPKGQTYERIKDIEDKPSVMTYAGPNPVKRKDTLTGDSDLLPGPDRSNPDTRIPAGDGMASPRVKIDQTTTDSDVDRHTPPSGRSRIKARKVRVDWRKREAGLWDVRVGSLWGIVEKADDGTFSVVSGVTENGKPIVLIQTSGKTWEQAREIAERPLVAGAEAEVRRQAGSVALEKGFKESDADPKELAMGTAVELEHTDDPEKSKDTALDHLAEMPDYYSRLKKMEAEGGVTAAAKPACACEDTTCDNCDGDCYEYATTRVYSTRFDDPKGVPMCEECADSAEEGGSYARRGGPLPSSHRSWMTTDVYRNAAKPEPLGSVWTATAKCFAGERLVGYTVDTPNSIAQTLKDHPEIDSVKDNLGKTWTRESMAARILDREKEPLPDRFMPVKAAALTATDWQLGPYGFVGKVQGYTMIVDNTRGAGPRSWRVYGPDGEHVASGMTGGQDEAGAMRAAEKAAEAHAGESLTVKAQHGRDFADRELRSLVGSLASIQDDAAKALDILNELLFKEHAGEPVDKAEAAEAVGTYLRSIGENLARVDFFRGAKRTAGADHWTRQGPEYFTKETASGLRLLVTRDDEGWLSEVMTPAGTDAYGIYRNSQVITSSHLSTAERAMEQADSAAGLFPRSGRRRLRAGFQYPKTAQYAELRNALLYAGGVLERTPGLAGLVDAIDYAVQVGEYEELFEAAEDVVEAVNASGLVAENPDLVKVLDRIATGIQAVTMMAGPLKYAKRAGVYTGTKEKP